jgi:hypothetical protein
VHPDPSAVTDARHRRAVGEGRVGVRDHRPVAHVAAGADVDARDRHEHGALADPRARADPYGPAARVDPAALAELAAVLQHHPRATRHGHAHAALDVHAPAYVDPAVELEER